MQLKDTAAPEQPGSSRWVRSAQGSAGLQGEALGFQSASLGHCHRVREEPPWAEAQGVESRLVAVWISLGKACGVAW